MGTNAHLLAEIAALRSQLDDAQATIRTFTADMRRDVLALAGVARLTRSESEVVAHLMRRGRVSVEALLDALYSQRDKQPGRNIISMHICAIRRKLHPFGIEIRTLWGFGIEMTADNIAKLRALMMPYIDTPPLQAALSDMVAA